MSAQPIYCVVCRREQERDASGLYPITKGWHDVRIKTGGNPASNFGNNLYLAYPQSPCRSFVDAVCPDCLPVIIERYTKAMEDWK